MRRGCWWCGRAARRSWRTAPFATCPNLLLPGDRLVVNDTKVIPAQLTGRRLGSPGALTGPRDRRDTDPAARRGALAGLGQARPQAHGRRHGAVRRGGQGLFPRRARRDRRGEGRSRRGDVRLHLCRPGARRGDRRARRDAAAALYRRAPRRRRARPRRLPDRLRAARRARSRRRPPACISREPLVARLAERGIGVHTVTLHVGAGTFLPVQGRGHRRAQDACRMGRTDASTSRPRSMRRAGQAGASSPSARHRCACLRRAARRDGTIAPFCRRDLALHHARLPLPRRRCAAHQFPPAALDAVHAGRGLLRARHDETRLCACDRRQAIASIPMAMPACFHPEPAHDRFSFRITATRRRGAHRRARSRRMARCARRPSCRSAPRAPSRACTGAT